MRDALLREMREDGASEERRLAFEAAREHASAGLAAALAWSEELRALFRATGRERPTWSGSDFRL